MKLLSQLMSGTVRTHSMLMYVQHHFKSLGANRHRIVITQTGGT